MIFAFEAASCPESKKNLLRATNNRPKMNTSESKKEK